GHDRRHRRRGDGARRHGHRRPLRPHGRRAGRGAVRSDPARARRARPAREQRVERLRALARSVARLLGDRVAPLGLDVRRWAARAESAEFPGRAVAALAADPRVLEKSGRVFTTPELAREYGFTDVDGSTMSPWWREYLGTG